MLYEALAGERPEGAFPPLHRRRAEVPARLDQVVMRLLQAVENAAMEMPSAAAPSVPARDVAPASPGTSSAKKKPMRKGAVLPQKTKSLDKGALSVSAGAERRTCSRHAHPMR